MLSVEFQKCIEIHLIYGPCWVFRVEFHCFNGVIYISKYFKLGFYSFILLGIVNGSIQNGSLYCRVYLPAILFPAEKNKLIDLPTSTLR
jgi:hypothetical protein